MSEQKIKQDEIRIGENIKAIRKQKKIKQIDAVLKNTTEVTEKKGEKCCQRGQ